MNKQPSRKILDGLLMHGIITSTLDKRMHSHSTPLSREASSWLFSLHFSGETPR